MVCMWRAWGGGEGTAAYPVGELLAMRLAAWTAVAAALNLREYSDSLRTAKQACCPHTAACTAGVLPHLSEEFRDQER